MYELVELVSRVGISEFSWDMYLKCGKVILRGARLKEREVGVSVVFAY